MSYIGPILREGGDAGAAAAYLCKIEGGSLNWL
jgi:hypothetical protein